MTKEELTKEVLERYPDMMDMGKEPIKTFGEFSTGIYDAWFWFDRDATYKDYDGQIKPRFNKTLRSGHKFLQDATIEELQELISVTKPKMKI